MSDLVARLRGWQNADNLRKNIRSLCGEAADEIERLRTDHIAAHRVSVMTIRYLENRLSHAEKE